MSTIVTPAVPKLELNIADPTTASQKQTVDGLGTASIADGSKVLYIAAATANTTVVSANPGRLCRVVLVAQGVNANGTITLYDNASAASGTVIGIIPYNAANGTSYNLGFVTANGITASGNANNAGIVVTYN